ncbi:SOS-induced cell division inhibitor SulA [Pseudomonas typographi]|uniref:CDP-glycerol--UDP-pyrophosphoryl-N-acetylglucosaminyl-N-acetylmannosamine glycerophosphotransferase n=1 Tax=Pseudomonas typographi TaxID=2715964 RepID=A0ABR7Z873_9PSED|nr:SOS-induced cell division inhibitor SulA [Pseudomonas typographi]MBD1554226.1 CDP-glycerol--UDP-pyrophosphoryl-N-acetylglucosaminyl-N-acetylmannosamine glycerophosphotransferase [Pseudomonas typographi]MBD1586668.1 CDP-glycerol--UDP-pyrophosphoryl-N-acetylglucosaminyl-N-acetylmannosamine glycerophosphotransferase [Pseudomonas typographi]MBD1601664.1 CDP-glycerol--UDP-pyrophosphoryl-N-acetylglucosaminyl-N-acetylmannosamine glycerophosphotransferase [Pseudomonas typographi]
MQCIPAIPTRAQQAQLSLFEVFMAPTAEPLLETHWVSPADVEEPEVFSELALRGSAGSCLSLMAPVLQSLSQAREQRWLTLVAPPASLTHTWLREAGLNRERIRLLQPRRNQPVLELACEALALGNSHTVVSWLTPLASAARQQLVRAALAGQAQSLNIRLG